MAAEEVWTDRRIREERLPAVEVCSKVWISLCVDRHCVSAVNGRSLDEHTGTAPLENVYV